MKIRKAIQVGCYVKLLVTDVLLYSRCDLYLYITCDSPMGSSSLKGVLSRMFSGIACDKSSSIFYKETMEQDIEELDCNK